MSTSIQTQARSVFADEADGLFARYHVEIQFEGKLMGGVPRDPKIIEGWLRSKAGVSDSEEVRMMMLRTLSELGADVDETSSFDAIVAASEALAGQRQTNGFKRDEHGLYIEDRQIKAAIKESVNILYAGERWGKTKKGPRSFTAERVFVRPSRIHLGRQEPDGVEMVIGHVSGPQGQRSTVGYHEYVELASIAFELESLEDCIDRKDWARIWFHAERNGLGALRSQSFGRFAVTRFDLID